MPQFEDCVERDVATTVGGTPAPGIGWIANPVAQVWNPTINSRRIFMRRTVLAVMCLLVCEVGLASANAKSVRDIRR